MSPPRQTNSSRSQTLDRGLSALTIIATSNTPLTIGEVATDLGLGRSVTYRMIRTLEDHRLVTRDVTGRLTGGTQLVALARGVKNDMQTAAAPILATLANLLGMTAFLVVSDSDEAVTVQVAEPTSTAAHVAYRPGTHHPLDRGAPGIALLAGDAPKTSERPEVTQARVLGWAYSEGEVIEGMASIAAPVTSADGATQAAVAIVHLAAGLDSIQVAPRVVEAARCLGIELA
jgi:DNA-binding IclR family transcriptional regulator